MIQNIRHLFTLILILELLSACSTDPAATDFAAPKLGAVTVEAEAFQARISCPVSGSTAGVTSYGFRFGEGFLSEIPALLVDGVLTATVKGLASETTYQVEAFLGNGAETLTTDNVVFRTEAGEETVTIPDPVFRRYIQQNFDKNDDEVLTLSEALKINEIEVCTDSIYSLRGIEKMSQLRRLTADGSPWGNGNLYEVDLSGNPKLEFCRLESNELHTIDLSGNPLLQNISLNVNPLDSIDFSHNPLIREVGLNGTDLKYLPEMTFLDLTSLHFSYVARFIPADYFRHFPNMNSFNIGHFQGKKFDLTLNPYINNVWCDNAPNIEELDFTSSHQKHFENIHTRNCPKLRRILLRAGTTIGTLEKDNHTEIVYIEYPSITE